MTNTIRGPGLNALEKIESLKSSKVDSLNKKSGEIQQAGFSDLLVGKLDKGAVQAKAENIAPEKSGDLKFSAHAKSRLSSRGIELTAEDLVKMKDAISRADKKGSKESLVVTDKAAFVVSVKNNTVITAMDRESLKENVFTNIDSTILI